MGSGQSGKIKIITILFIFLFLAILITAGYIFAKKWWVQNQPRNSLVGMKIDPDVLSWSFRVTPEFYAKIIAIDDMIQLFDSELARYKELSKKYPDQKEILSKESKHINDKKDELTKVLNEAGKAMEAIYITDRIDTRKAKEKIGSKETYDLGKKLTSTLKTHSRLAYRIKTQNPENWMEKVKKIIK